MLKIQFPTKKELIDAINSADNEDELTDRELWILSEFGGDLE